MTETIRRAEPADTAELAKLRALLWPKITPRENHAEIDRYFTSEGSGVLPTVAFVSQIDSGALTGFVEVGIRSHADGCDPNRPVGFIEGWFVCKSSRNQGIGRQLMRAAEDWARARRCNEMASDALIENRKSQRAHKAVGFEVVDRCVHFRKNLR